MSFKECKICLNSNAKYKCPKCEIHTCCLSCVDKHKIRYDCNGLRIRKTPNFVDSKNYSQTRETEDIAFLQNISRNTKALSGKAFRILHPKIKRKSWKKKKFRKRRNKK
ncbi:Box C/D snoRNA protein 1 [Bonamia ostreae]|uniref:Box C/D snoRNA protein 1 n=1 Tax=Bonamia ostreae TaxID=126728 RepID=A0ABV2ALL5_9EUKA